MERPARDAVGGDVALGERVCGCVPFVSAVFLAAGVAIGSGLSGRGAGLRRRSGLVCDRDN